MRSFVVVLALLQALGHVDAQSPVTKVIQMLTDMQSTGNKELKTEQDVFAKYGKFVRLRTQELEYDIKTAKAKIEELTATITKGEADIEVLTGELAKNEAETADLETRKKAATELRESEHTQFLAEQTSYTESLYALDRAIQMLAAQNYDRPQAEALLQKMAKTTKGMRRVLAEVQLLQLSQNSAEMPAGAPAVAAYEFQSTSILAMLKNLNLKFKDELGVLEKEEMNSAHAFEMSDIHMSNTIDNLKKDHASMTENKARIAAEVAAAKDELADQQANLAEAEGFLKEVTSTFAAKQATYESNQQLRKDEIAAIGKAIEILSQPEIAGNYAKHIAELVQAAPVGISHAPVFLQTLSAKATVKQVAKLGQHALRESTAKYLRGKSESLKSKALAMVADQLKDNPFAKVIDLIENLLERLKEDAASEAEHKEFCDEELRKNKIKRKECEATAARLREEIEQKKMQIVEMAKDIQILSEEQAALQKALAEATETRKAEKEANLIAIKDAQESLVALKQAIAVLKEFYSKNAFLQVKKQIPEMAEYKGMHGRNVGVTGMLEVIQTDFVRLETDTKAEEEAAAAEYARFSKETEDAIETKHKAEFKLSLRKDQTEFEQSQLEKDLDATLEQLKMANAYFEELKPQCVEVNVSFKERAARRQEEIEALQDAYRALDNRGKSE